MNITKKIELSKQLKKDFKKGYISTIDMIKFLTTKGFNTNSELKKTSLSLLFFEGRQVKNAIINKNYIELKF